MNLRNILKPVKILGISVLMLTGQSCKDLLKETVISGIPNDYMNTPKGFEDAVNAAYSTLRYFYGTQQGLTLTEYGTDIYATGADGGYKGFHFYDTQMQPTVDYLGNTWDELYRGINTCNAIIERAPASTVADATKKVRVAEAKFLRAQYYFILFQQWGGVDLRLNETLAPTKTTKRASDTEMFSAIIKDFTEAIADLPSTQSQYGRATKAAAEMALAKVYLAKAYSTSKAADDFSKAATLSESVIKNYGFKLLDDFASVFDENNQKNSEIVFAVQYTSDLLTNLTNNTGNVNGGNNLHLFFGMQYDVQAGMQRDVFYGRPFKRLRPTAYLIDVCFADRENDSRYKKTFRDTWKSNKPGTYNTAFDDSKAKVTFASGDTTIFIPGYEMSKEERAKRPYQVLVPSKYNEALFPTLTKFFDTKRPDMTYESGSRDYFMFRLADTYLMLAEAQLGAGKIQEATDALNVVRQRAAWAGKKDAMKITSDKMNMEMLMQERARELAGEQTRWMDLKRWGNLVERVKLYNPQAAPNVASKHLVRPIPQTQIDRSEPGAFAQNPGF
ncbi:MAG: RagB/SusD family nutrient uptake outer membrane protein [Cytophagaceae bacterium]|nr:RagB/SusD family nutrient uptake outer membrane protein [Cytophagaceae bacterium]MBK9935577.1 RagB/SusD family nutrient uptake outer membrane protein [Cytophagaceae bacterium]MBL0302023.1 RagB/SusD family nutrient uptake outer membrane protein [Cytophagaceae bacterium]MBL0324845.1 RagB/SusD family nutrient uptake outer membrane protein [Cytophagaceae bacterium]